MGWCWQVGGLRPTAYRRNARGLRGRQAFERIRMQAGELLAAGRSSSRVTANSPGEGRLGWKSTDDPAGCTACCVVALPTWTISPGGQELELRAMGHDHPGWPSDSWEWTTWGVRGSGKPNEHGSRDRGSHDHGER